MHVPKSCCRRGLRLRPLICALLRLSVLSGNVCPAIAVVTSGQPLGRRESFLCSALAPAAQLLYNRLASEFDDQLRAATGVDASTMDECMIDYALADEVIDLYAAHDGMHGIARALQLVAAMAKRHPRHRYTTAFATLDVFGVDDAPRYRRFQCRHISPLGRLTSWCWQAS